MLVFEFKTVYCCLHISWFRGGVRFFLSLALSFSLSSALCAGSPRLAKLTLTACLRLRAPRIGGARVRELNLSLCAELEDGAVDALCVACPRLTDLNLWRCAALAQLPRLRRLSRWR